MAWCEAHGIHYVFGLAGNPRLEALIADELAEAEAKSKESGKPERLFKELRYQTLKTWSCERRVVAKAEHLPKGKNPRFVVTSLTSETVEAQELYEKIYCARGDMENRIKECQLDLFRGPNLGGEPQRQSAEAVVRLARLCAHDRPAPHCVARNGTGAGYSRNYPAQTPEARRACHRQRPAGQDRHRLRLSAEGRLRAGAPAIMFGHPANEPCGRPATLRPLPSAAPLSG